MTKKRNTIHKALVYEAVNRLKSHPTAEEVYRYVVKDHPNVSKATVYRNLRQLAESVEISELQLPGGAERFDHITEPHYHVRCCKCGRFADVDMKYLPGLPEHITDSNGFAITGHDIVFRGTCPECSGGQTE